MYIIHTKIIDGKIVEDEYGYSNPARPSPPGLLIDLVLEQFKHWSVGEFAARMDIETVDAYELIYGIKPITQPLAAKLGEVLGAGEKYWLRQESLYRNHRASLANTEEGSAMIERPMNNVDTADAQAKEAVKVVGNPDRWCLLSKASAEGWMRSTKAMWVEGGALVQVSTLQRNPDGSHAVAEAIAHVPSVRIVEDVNGGHKLVKQ